MPLSYAQSRLWFLDRLTPGNTAYNLPGAIRMRGRLDVAVLERSLSEVVRRHEALRTTFEEVKGEPVQRIHRSVEVPLPVEDVSALAEPAREIRSRELAREEAQRPFDLSRGPLVRAKIVKLGAEDHVLLFTMHHIVSDGWSMGVLVREVRALYEAYVADGPSPLPELPIQYADYAEWQRGWLEGQELDRQLGYWKAQLEGMPVVLDLPTDRPRPPVQTFRGATLVTQLSAEVKRAVQEVSRKAGATEFMTLLSAFGVLLSRYTGQQALVIGSPVANRTRQEIEGLIGFFVNTLALGLRVDEDESFKDLLEDVKTRTLGAYAHQDLPFEKLVEALKVERDRSRSPLFQVMFVLQNAPQTELELPSLELTVLEPVDGVSKFDLTLSVQHAADAYALVWEYNTDLFDRQTVERMAIHYQMLLEASLSSPERTIGSLPILPASERKQLLEDWNATEASYPRARSVVELFEVQVDRRPDAPAVVFEDRLVTYRELDALANRIAQGLRLLGVGREDRVAVFMQRSVELVATLVGVLKAGAVYLPIDPTYPSDRIDYMMSDSGARVVVTHRSLRDTLGARDATVLEADGDLSAYPSKRLGVSTHPRAAAYMIYTSGSTGRPKGVVNTHAGLLNRLQWGQHALALDDSDAVLQKTPFSFDVSLWEFLWPLTTGARLVVARPDGHKDSAYLCELIAATGTTTVHFVPSMLDRFLVEPQLSKCASLRRVICSGEALSYATTRRFHSRLDAELHNLYGPTEASIEVTWWPCGSQDPGPAVPIGRPIANTQTYILDAEMRLVPIGVAGELHLGGVQVARGYAGRPSLTAERFVPNPFAAGERLYKTGDRVRCRPDGAIEYLGRLDHQVKVRGFRIELGEIESVLAGLDDVREAVVVAREDTPGDTRLVAYVVATNARAVDAGALREHLQEKLPEYMVPSAFVPLDKLPVTPNGKVDRDRLPRPQISQATASAQPRDPLDERLCVIFAEALGVPAIGLHDDFFDLGGHSLLAIQVVSRVRAELGFDVALGDLFDHPTIALFRSRITSRTLPAGARQIAGRAGGADQPMSSPQLRHWLYSLTDRGSSAFNIRAALRIRGRLDVDVLKLSFDEVVRRHESLRTTFYETGDALVQRIHPVMALDFSLQDLRALPESQRDERVIALAKEAGERPFDLMRGPPLRVRVLRLGETEHVLLFTVHHIVFDGWSGGVLADELSALYSAYLEGRPSPLPEPTIQYADYAAWQREQLEGDALREQLGYWTSQLRDVPLTVAIPTVGPRPPRRTFRGATLVRRLDDEVRRQVREVSRAAGATEFVTLLAAFGVLLSEASGQPRVVVGSPIVGRRHPEAFRLIGYFVNWLPLQVHVRRDETFEDLLRDVRERTLGAYMHQDLPFEMLLRALEIETDPSLRSELQIMFVVVHPRTATLELPGLDVNALNVPSDIGRFDLALFVIVSENGFELNWESSSDLFDEATISRLAARFERLLGLLLMNPREEIERRVLAD